MSGNPLKNLLHDYRLACATFEPAGVRDALQARFAPDATIRLCHPFGEVSGPDAFYDTALAPLFEAMPDLERRDMIVLSGTTPEGQDWIGTMGNYMGTFLSPLLDIAPTGHLAHLRFHEFFRLQDGRVTEMQAIWDLPELMMLAGVWPMAPQLGAYLCTPGPMTGDGLHAARDGTGEGEATQAHVLAMLTDLCRHPADPDPAVMQLEKYWHPRANWYGPAGIGTARGVAGFRHWHQIPFLRGMPDRKLDLAADLRSHWVAEGDYVCETGWPNMRLSLGHDGWMGIAPSGKEVLMRSLDFWRLENGLIRENWVLVDLLDVYRQVGVDVFARLREFNKARRIAPIDLPDASRPL